MKHQCRQCCGSGWYVDYGIDPATGENVQVQVACKRCQGEGWIPDGDVEADSEA